MHVKKTILFCLLLLLTITWKPVCSEGDQSPMAPGGNMIYHDAVDYAVDNIGGGTGYGYIGGFSEFAFGGNPDQCWKGHLGVFDGTYVDDGDGSLELMTLSTLLLYSPSPYLTSEHTADFSSSSTPVWAVGDRTGLGFYQFTYANEGLPVVIIELNAFNRTNRKKEMKAYFYSDFDAGSTFDDNIAGYDPEREMVYVQDVDEKHATAAIAVIRGEVDNWILSNNGSEVSPSEDGGGDDAKTSFLLGETGGDYTDGTPKDCDLAVSVNVGELFPKEHSLIAFVVVGVTGRSPAEALAAACQAVDLAKRHYHRISVFLNEQPSHRHLAVPHE